MDSENMSCGLFISTNVGRNIMRHPILILAFFICCFEQAKANKIDSLKTGKDVESFISALIKQKYNIDYYTFHLAKPDSVYNYFTCDSTIKWESGIWQKTDFNKDGLTDLFTIIYEMDTINSRFPKYTVYVVIGQKNNKYQLNEIPGYFMINCYSVKSIIINNYPCLLYRHYKTDYTIDTLPGVDTIGGMAMPHTQAHYFEVGRTDTLIYRFGGFVELNTTNKNIPAIKSIYYETSPCLGSCPIFSLNIFKDGTAYYNSHENPNESNGNFRGTINQIQLDEIIALINYIYTPNLKDYYSVNATDMQSCKLKIYFSDGSVKEITDYGLRGTLGLVRLYDLLFTLRLNQQWK
jgi:Domain of unknown function (DUF6438)